MSNHKFTPDQVAAIAGVSLATVMRHIRRKTIKVRRVRSYSIDGDQVKEFLVKQATVGKAGRRKTAKGT
jgi:hypothetical protein